LNAPGAVQGIEHGSQLLLCLRIGEHPLIEPVRNASRRFQYNSAFLFMNRSGPLLASPTLIGSHGKCWF
jgi:hypothetical protein